ncbi:MAG: serine/threonine-protein kinase [Kofleriaceae bacterium]
MRCLDDDMVLGLVEGRLAPPVLATVDEHLDACASCRDVVTQVARSLSTPPALERGASVGRYVIGDLVGEGAMGRVYSAWEPDLDRRVALKLLTTPDAGARDRAIREAKSMAKLDHPNVVGVHEVGTAGATTYVAMELVEGDTLRAYVIRRRSLSGSSSGPSSGSPSGASNLSWREIATILADIARGLAAVHAAGVIHRDVKPDNIVVGRDHRARIADFGLARAGVPSSWSSSPALAAGSIDGSIDGDRAAIDGPRSMPGRPANEGTLHGTVLAGTPAYMAPEVVDGASATPASDQFSFGVTAYEVLAGSRPFEATTFAELRAAYGLARSRSSDPPDSSISVVPTASSAVSSGASSSPGANRTAITPLRGVPSWLDAAVQRCLSIDPAARFSSLVDFADVVTRGLQPSQRPRLVLGGIAAAAIVASGATYLALRAPSSGPTCTSGAPEIAGVWNANTRGTLVAIGEPSLRALDEWTTAWATERDTTCRASEYEPPAMTTARNRCLDRRRDEAAALIAALSTVSNAPTSNASNASASSVASRAYSSVDMLAALPAPAECAAAASDPADPIPADKTRAAIVLDVQRQLASLRATLALGDARPILDASTQLVETARSSQHAPTLAEAELLHADVLRATSQLAAAVVAVRSAAADAERGHADQLAAKIWLARVAIAGDRRDLESADDLIAIASGAIDRAGAPPRLVAMLLKHRGLIAYNRGQLEEARSRLVEAHATLVTLSQSGTSSSGASGASGASSASGGELGATIERIAVESALGSVERAAGNLDAAERWHQRAFDADLALRGDFHPDIARDLHNLAGVARLRGDLAVAHERYSRALAIEIATRGETSVEAGLTHNSLGLVALARAENGHMAFSTDANGRPKRAFDPAMLAEAHRQFTRARDIFVAANHGDRAFAEHNLGLVAAAAGDHRAALVHFDTAAAIYATTIGASADAAKRLVDDRAASSRALGTPTLAVGTAPTIRTTAATPTTPAKPTPTTPTRTTPTTTPTTPTPTTTRTTPTTANRTNTPTTSPITTPTTPKTPTKPDEPPKRDVGVYGSTQSW